MNRMPVVAESLGTTVVLYGRRSVRSAVVQASPIPFPAYAPASDLGPLVALVVASSRRHRRVRRRRVA